MLVPAAFFIVIYPQKLSVADSEDMIRLKTAFRVQKTVYFINKPKIP